MPVQSNKVSQRSDCIRYIKDNYEEWPKPYSTWHTATCHYGYSWTQKQNEGPWTLVHGTTKDEITEDDVLNFSEDIPLPSEVWIKLDNKQQIIDTSLDSKMNVDGWVKYSPASQ